MSKFRFDKKKIDTSALLDIIANNVVNYFKIETFNKEAFDGKKWKALKVPTGRRKLVKTGRLRQSIRVLGKTKTTRKVGTDVPYGVYHNEGTKYIPQRKFMGKSKRLDSQNEKIIDRFVKKSMAKK